MKNPSKPTALKVIIYDTREPTPHPWAEHLPEFAFQRQGMETGDFHLAGNPLLVIERKTVGDFLGSISTGRQRFNDEIRRARYLDGFHIIVEGGLAECLASRGQITETAILGTLAAFARRGFPVHFAGNQRCAAILAGRILTQPIAEANKLVKDTAAQTNFPATTPDLTKQTTLTKINI